MPDTSSAARSLRQPVHTVYGGAHLFAPDTTAKLGAIALKALREHAPNAGTLASAIGVEASLASRVYPRVVAKLERDAVEDFRIDFEDGFGVRRDAEEDDVAKRTAVHVADGMTAGTLPRGIGIRIKNLGDEMKRRSLRTLELFLSTLAERTGGALPENFVITLPKITSPEQVTHLTEA